MPESLEERRVMTTTVFLDFGEAFPAGELVTTAGEIRNTIFGPDLRTKEDPKITASSGIVLTSLESVANANAIDMNGSFAYEQADFIALRDSIVAKVERHFEPFDVNVVVNAAANLADVTRALSANAGDSSGQFDAYVFVTGAYSHPLATSIRTCPGGTANVVSPVV